MLWRKLIKLAVHRAIVPVLLTLAAVGVVAVASEPALQPDQQQAWLDLQHLSSDQMAGRATGSAGNALAREYLLHRFSQLALEPVEDGSFEQPFQFKKGFSKRVGVNVLGLRRGCQYPQHYVVVTAHYDHLPMRAGKIFNGADDNASGVAGLLYLAAQTQQRCPAYSYLFLATDAEELGLDGAKAFLAHSPVPLHQIALNINLDMISRGELDQRLYLAGKNKLPQLQQFAKQVQTPLKLTLAHDGRQSRLGRSTQSAVDWANASDHAVFRKAGIRYMYFGVDVHPQYHQPQDDWQRVDQRYFFAALALIEQSRRWFETLPLAPSVATASQAGSEA
jgi:Zn-dependent M28 family amino/carboxypeptidase